jgi:hypothetical protein
VSPKLILPGHIEHVLTPLSPLTSHTGAAAPSNNASDQHLVTNQRNCERFLKINVRHITDGQVGFHEIVPSVVHPCRHIACSVAVNV